jgi:hypothetical protein
VTATTAEAVRQRAAGQQVSRPRALLVAALAGTATAVAVYKLLRSGDDAAG